MKRLTVEVIVDEPGKSLEITGRCCRDGICVGDELMVESLPTSKVRIAAITLFGRRVGCLHTGYVGTVFVEIVAGEKPPLDSVLIGDA